MAGVEHTAAELRTYLRRRRSGRGIERDAVFENFLKDVSMLFSLRMAAEEYWAGSPRASDFNFAEHRYLANGLRGALPLEWKEIFPIVSPNEEEPRRTLITFIAAHCIEEVRMISHGLRKVLSRERLSTPVGKVQQLDTYCMRWLMRQPGRSFVEKAGTNQRVMAVVRHEQFDTLENRVFKDFLIRCENLADSYIAEIGETFPEHQIFKSVRSFYVACQGALALPEMDLISGISDLPRPNYVLQQDNRYSKIWNAYCKVIRLTNLADKLWSRRDELTEKLLKLIDESPWQCQHLDSVKYHTLIWFNPLDGVMEFFEQAKVHHAENGQSEQEHRKIEIALKCPVNNVAVIDFSGCHVWGTALSQDGYHQNARSRIYKPDFPLLDDELAEREKKLKKHYLRDFLPRMNDPKIQDNKDGDKTYHECSDLLSAYCARLFGECRNQDRNLSEIVVLSPDDWNTITQEQMIRSFPMLERKKVHLLWRSVATAIGLADEINELIEENDNVSVIDFRLDGTILISQLKFMREDESNRLIPQRSVYRRNEQINAERYALLKRADAQSIMSHNLVRRSKVVCLSGCISPSFKIDLKNQYCLLQKSESSRYIQYEAERGGKVWTIFEDAVTGWTQKDGALLFCHEHEKRTLYFDELEAMWIVGQDEIHEKIVCDALVEAEEKFPGGTSKKIPIARGRFNIGEGQRGVEFLFHIGTITDNTPLHRYKQELTGEFVRKRLPLDVEIEVSPGQGMALTTVTAPIFCDPIILDYLKNMELSKETIARKNDELERSFPPTSAIVEAMRDGFAMSFWGNETDTARQIMAFLDGRIKFSDLPTKTCLFYSARRKTENDLRAGESKLHLLDRYNVFGNVSYAMRPQWMTEEQEDRLFHKVVAGLRTDRSKALRLIAWTYRGSNEDISTVARNIFSRWIKGQSPNVAGEMKLWKSLLGNLLACKELSDLLPAFIQHFIRIGQLYGWDYDELRMFYYLLQFDEDFCVHAQLNCTDANTIAQVLCEGLKRYRLGGNTNTYDAALRSMLYLLRMREKERHFLRNYKKFMGPIPENVSVRDSMERTYYALDAELSKCMENERPATRALRKITRKFLNGSGTLPDVISIVGGD